MDPRGNPQVSFSPREETKWKLRTEDYVVQIYHQSSFNEPKLNQEADLIY